MGKGLSLIHNIEDVASYVRLIWEVQWHMQLE